MTIIMLLVFVGGPLIVLGIWLWLRSQREPIMLAEPMEIGRVLSGAFSAFAHWRVVVLAILVVGGLHAIEYSFVYAEVPKLVATVPPTQRVLDGALFGGLIGLIGYPIVLLFYLPATYALVRSLEGDLDPWREAFRTTLSGWLPMVGVAMLTFLGGMVGALLFIVPAVILVLNWAVVLPVAAVERPGVLATLSRSRALAMGSRGRILLVYILLGIIVAVVLGSSSFLQRAVGVTAGSPTGLAIQVVNSIINAILGVGLQTALYVELRRIRDGLTNPGLVEVFA